MFKTLLFSRPEMRMFLYLCGIFFVAYSYELSNFNISIDDEMIAYSHPSLSTDLGRWVHPLIRLTFWPQVVSPIGPLLILGCLLCVGFVYILKGFDFREPTFFHFAAFAAFIFFPTWIAQIEFSGNLMQVAIGTLAVCMAAYLTANTKFELTRQFLCMIMLVGG